MNHERLKRHLGGEAGEPEAEARRDPFLAEALEGLEQWQARHPGNPDDLFRDLDRLVDERTPPPAVPKRPKRRKPLPLLAACLAGLVCFGLFRLFVPASPPERLYALYFQPLAHPDMTLRGQPGNGNPEFEALRAYETEDYKQAMYQYRKLVAQDPGNEQYLLFLGISCLGGDQPEQAAAILKDPFTEKLQYQDDRLWYLALAYLRLGNFNTARTALVSLADNDYYAPKAAKLLKALP